jgi:Mg2+-importing ATPase
MSQLVPEFWTKTERELLAILGSSENGLSSEEAIARWKQRPHRRLRSWQSSPIYLYLNQLKSPITLILVGAAVLSFFLQDHIDAVIILFIVLVSSLLGFWQEYRAAGAVEKLLELIQTKSNVVRDGQLQQIPPDQIVSGDVIHFAAGDAIPADCLLLESKDLSVNESTLTGETFSVEKNAGVIPRDTRLALRSNVLYRGTHVVSGTGKAVAVHVEEETEFGKIAERLQTTPPETDFEHGVRNLGYFLMQIMLILVLMIFAINVYFHRPVVESLLFSLALAVGLTPQLLPAIITVNLSAGALRMAEGHVIVRRLSSIENLGSMNVLCSDKTGTLTRGVVEVLKIADPTGNPSESTTRLAFLNSSFETGFTNPIDESIRACATFDLSECRKLDEIPYDFIRKRLSILLEDRGQFVLITKGAMDNILDVCETVDIHGQLKPIDDELNSIRERYRAFGESGYRTLGIAYKHISGTERVQKSDETQMVFAGFIVLRDPPKDGIAGTIQNLSDLGVSLKMITGDNRLVAMNIAQQIGLNTELIITGHDLRNMTDEALVHQVQQANVFAEIEPNQKERIVRAFQKAGNVVGYMGDGINDATALRAADVGISVDQAIDVAKEAADIVLLKQDLNVLLRGVREGRVTFANTMKYIFIATSANFGNMFSMAGASLFLPFLPLLPKQILLMNLLTDIPELTIAGDRVDDELIAKPQKWDIRFIKRFMLVFGPISSIFDFATFGVLLLILKAKGGEFQAGWFLESVVSAALVVLVVRTRRPLIRSLPSRGLLLATALCITATFVLPWTPIATALGFDSIPPRFLLPLTVIVLIYVFTAEIAKQFFFRWNSVRRSV